MKWTLGVLGLPTITKTVELDPKIPETRRLISERR
jgi:hypothetical protein